MIDIFLQPGEYFVGDASYTIRTLLGSCVSITLWHPQKKVGAMSHFLLPSSDKPHKKELDGRYGEDAMQLMLHELARYAIRPEECHAKIFGGGNMFPSQSNPMMMHIGARNGEAARALLQRYGINVVSESLYGSGHRQIRFHIHNGDVWVRQPPLVHEHHSIDKPFRHA